MGFLGGLGVKNSTAMQETQVWFLGWEDSPGEGNGNSSTLFWEVPWTEEPGGLQFIGPQELDSD